MKSGFWDSECWGDAYPPMNYDEIISAVNEHLDSIEDDDSRNIESERLWAQLCDSDEVLGIEAIYGGDENDAE